MDNPADSSHVTGPNDQEYLHRQNPANHMDSTVTTATNTSVSEPTTSEGHDGLLTLLGVRLIKATTCMFLEDIVNELLRETCYGCEIDQSIQRHHTCLYEPEEFYFEDNIIDITKRQTFCKPSL
ncbi:hypothetical protein AAFF_G00409760 [Aldrovandia affinis]|uniref:Uncharacterized protein n=1 Tax=Aldrovandia affinis TaxID=143900 RepID=A0AAD7SBN6_9TELE|nr:hypothetical protein AAFF_G00409760 [Aldrovandia affinis]